MPVRGTSGVYSIRCVATGKRYIGSGIDISVRWTAHRVALRKGNHHNLYLQRAWNKYGEVQFSFETIEIVVPHDLLTRESDYIKEFRSADRRYGFNVNLTAWSRLGRPHKPSTIELMSAAKKGNKSRLGKPHSAETKLKISASQKGKIIPADQRAKISRTLMGSQVSTVARLKISIANKGKPKPHGFGRRIAEARAFFSVDEITEVRRLAKTGDSRRKIARQFGPSHNVVSKVLDGNGPFYGDVIG